MAKLYFRYGTVGSAKTLNLLAVCHNYRQQGKEVFLIKPELDTRFGREKVRSRAGLEMDADLLVQKESVIAKDLVEGVSCVLVDEAQFLSAAIIDQLREITREMDIPAICYGLRTDFKSHLFEGSRRLMEVADSIEEVKSTCYFCNRKSIFNLKHVDGVAVKEGPSIQLGAEELYFPVCHRCYVEAFQKAKEKQPSCCSH
jgi:thymidine kinase